MKRLLTIAIIAGALSFIIQFSQAKPVVASGPTTPYPVLTSTSITLVSPGEIFESKPFILAGYLKDAQGNAIAGKHVSFVISGTAISQASTNGDGYFQLTVNKAFTAGIYECDGFLCWSRLFWLQLTLQ